MEELTEQLKAIIERIEEINTQLREIADMADVVSREIFLKGKSEGLEAASKIIEKVTE